MQLTGFRWKRWLAGVAGLLAVYALAGFWLIPAVLRDQLPKFGKTELLRQASIGEVRFNPFTLRFEAKDLRLAEADGAPLFSVGSLAVEMQWSSLLRRAWTFGDIRVTAPSVRLAIAADGRFNIAEFLATLDRKPHEPSSGLPRLIIGRFALEKGKVDMQDQRAGYKDSFTPIDFALTNFSTLPEQNGSTILTAESQGGGRLRWKGEASVNPIRGSGELALENVALPEFGAYLKSISRASATSGTLSATLPYRFSYVDGKFDAAVSGARLGLRDLALRRTATAAVPAAATVEPFATLARLDVTDVGADLTTRAVTVGGIGIEGATLAMRRDARGELDLANLMTTPARAAAPTAATPAPSTAAATDKWKVNLRQLAIDKVAITLVDETVRPPARISAGNIGLHLQLSAEQTGSDLKLTVAKAALALADLSLASGGQTPVRLAQLGFTEGEFDLAGHHASIGRLYADGGQLQLTRDRKGVLTLLDRLPKAVAGDQAAKVQTRHPAAPAAGPAWTAAVQTVELGKINADIDDDASGIQLQVLDLGVKVEGASSDPGKPVRFNAGLRLGAGGQMTAQGNLVPATGALQTDLQVSQLQLAPLQPLLSQYLKLRLADGSVSTKGRLETKPAAGASKGISVRYAGGFDIAGLTLNELTGERFASWKSVGADKLTVGVAPNLLDIPVLRVVEPNATLIIENDRSLNAARLLVKPATATAPTTGPTTASAIAPGVASTPALTTASAASPAAVSTANADPFPVRIGQLRIQNAKLDFTDLSLRPQFGAKIYELNGVISGLSSARDARSQLELDGRVDEFGLARIRGALNPFAPRDNTNVNVVFKNVDLVSASPYSMKFAGYRIAEGKISLDLQYKVRDSQLEGSNQIVFDNLTLGERVDSPDALKLPLELALAILKDSDGRIDLGLPVSGDLRDPQFSYGAIVWKAIGNVLSKIVTAPFRALGSLFGVSADKLEAVDFDAGSDRLLPPEREKLKQVAQILAKRAQLHLSVPGQYSEAADGAALKKRAVRLAIAKHAGITLEDGENPGPQDPRDRAVRGALRDLYVERFGAAELDKQKKAAESSAAPSSTATDTAPQKTSVSLLQRVGNLIQGEPQVADTSAFYRSLRARLDAEQPLAADTLTRLGASRAAAIVAVLKEEGVDPARVQATPPEKVDAGTGKPVPVKLALGAK